MNWFSATAVIQDLSRDWHLDAATAGWLTNFFGVRQRQGKLGAPSSQQGSELFRGSGYVVIVVRILCRDWSITFRTIEINQAGGRNTVVW